MYLYIEDIKNDKVGFFGAMTIEKIAKICGAWWGDAFQEEKIHKFDAKAIHDVNLDEIPKILRDAMKNYLSQKTRLLQSKISTSCKNILALYDLKCIIV